MECVDCVDECCGHNAQNAEKAEPSNAGERITWSGRVLYARRHKAKHRNLEKPKRWKRAYANRRKGRKVETGSTNNTLCKNGNLV